MPEPLHVVDLFAGLKGWSAPFAERGHRTWTTDYEPKFRTDLSVDVRDLRAADVPFRKIDVLFASPPCETFSVASIGHHWTGGARAYVPKTEEAKTGIAVVRAIGRFLEDLRRDGREPRSVVIENPRGVLRNLSIMPIAPRTIWYCHYGETRAKPTDLWGLPFPRLWTPEPECHNRRDGHVEECCCADHEAARRGAKTGTQGISGYAERSVIPRELSLSFCLALEAESAVDFPQV